MASRQQRQLQTVAGMPGQQGLEGQYSQFNQSMHPRQQSMPAAMYNKPEHVFHPGQAEPSTYASPPHSTNMSPPPQHQPVMSSPPTATMTSSNMMMMSPPQSVQSNMSPLHHGLSPPHHGHTMSPVKARQGGQQQQQQQQQLPTSPTHMAAMRGATQQARQAANSQFDFPEMFSQQQ